MTRRLLFFAIALATLAFAPSAGSRPNAGSSDRPNADSFSGMRLD